MAIAALGFRREKGLRTPTNNSRSRRVTSSGSFFSRTDRRVKSHFSLPYTPLPSHHSIPSVTMGFKTQAYVLAEKGAPFVLQDIEVSPLSEWDVGEVLTLRGSLKSQSPTRFL